MTQTTTKAFIRSGSLALIFGLSTLATGSAFAQGPARDGKGFERIAERMKDRCEKFEARLASMDKKLTADQVRDIVAGRLAEAGNANIKVGKVATKGDVVSIEIVTQDGSLVTTREISSKTGLPPEAAQRCDKLDERLEQAKANRADGDGPRRGIRGERGERGERGMRGGRGDMMGAGFGLGLMGGRMGPDRDLNLSADQVKKLAEARLIMMGNPRLKIGAVKEKDAETYVVDIVTVDNSLVAQREFDKDSGRGKPIRN